jgi:hypothetical protein
MVTPHLTCHFDWGRRVRTEAAAQKCDRGTPEDVATLPRSLFCHRVHSALCTAWRFPGQTRLMGKVGWLTGGERSQCLGWVPTGGQLLHLSMASLRALLYNQFYLP